MRYRALLVGNSQFDQDDGLGALNAPTRDVARLYGALVDETTGLFRSEDVVLLVDATSQRITAELYDFFDSGRKDDLLLFYYSGHGVPERRGELFLCGRDTRRDQLPVTAVGNARINDFIARSAARQTVIVLDCCYSGLFKGGELGDQLAGPGRFVVSCAHGSDLASDATTSTGTSPFTDHFVAGLTGKARDGNGDGYVDLCEIYDYVKSSLKATSSTQVPTRSFVGDGDVPLARATPQPADPAARHSFAPTFGLGTNAITRYGLEPGAPVPPEAVPIFAFGDEPLDCHVQTTADWLDAEVRDQHVVLHLRPREGANQADVVVRDRVSGGTQSVRVVAYVRPRAATPAPVFHGSPAPAVPPRPPTDRLAVGAFVTALAGFLLSCLLIGGPVGVAALVLAHHAGKRVAASEGRVKGGDLVISSKVFGWTAIALSIGMTVAVILAPPPA
jgi:hypothetical protein